MTFWSAFSIEDLLFAIHNPRENMPFQYWKEFMAQKCKGLGSCGYDVLQIGFYQDLTAECAYSHIQ